jgi:integral membrane protein
MADGTASAEQPNQEVRRVRAAVLRYRVMAYITGVLIIIVCFVGIPLQVAANQTFIVKQIGTVHGYLYLVYIVMAWMLASRLKLGRGATVLLLLAGTVPVMTFVVERWLTRRYIDPALAAQEGAAPPAGSPAAENVPRGPR